MGAGVVWEMKVESVEAEVMWDMHGVRVGV